MEGSGMGSAGCGVHVDVHGGVSYVVGGCDVVAMLRMAGMVCLEVSLASQTLSAQHRSLSVCGTQREEV